MDKNENVKNKLKSKKEGIYFPNNNQYDINNRDILNIPNENKIPFPSENTSEEGVTISQIKLIPTSASSKITIIEPLCKLEKFLPPLNILNQNKKTLVLDLDETLIHSFFDHPPPRAPDISFDIIMDKKKIHVSSILRPGVHEFLENLENLYEIVIFTASLSQYANPLLDFIDKKGIFKYRLFREHCYCYTNGFGNSFVKDLKKLDREMKNLIIIDNNPKSFMLNKENGVPIKTWMDDSNDKELYKLIPYLIFLGNQKIEDVRPFLKDINSGTSLNYEKFDKIIIEFNNKKEKDLEDELNKLDMKRINQNIFDSINIKIENENNNNKINNNNYKNDENNKENANKKEYKNKNLKNKDIISDTTKLTEKIFNNKKISENKENKENIINNNMKLNNEIKINKDINKNNENLTKNKEIQNKIQNQNNIINKNKIINNDKEQDNKNIKKENNDKNNTEKKDKINTNINNKIDDNKNNISKTNQNGNKDLINLSNRNNSVNNKEKFSRKFNYNRPKNNFIELKKNNTNSKFENLLKEENSQPPNEYRSIELKNPDDFNLIQGEIKKNSKTITPSITTREKTTISLNKNNIEKKRENNNFFIKKSSFLNTFKSCQIKNEEDLKIMNNFQYKTSNEMLNDFIKNINRNSSLDSAKKINNSLQFSEKENTIINDDIDEEEKNINEEENNNQEPLFDIVDTEKNEINLEKSKSLEKESLNNEENEENKYEIKNINKAVKDKFLLKRKKRKKYTTFFNKGKIFKNSIKKDNKLFLHQNNDININNNINNDNKNNNNKTNINNNINQKQLLSEKFPRYLSKKKFSKGIFNYSTVNKKEQMTNKIISPSYQKIFKIKEGQGIFLKNKSNMNNDSIDLLLTKTKSIVKNNSNIFNLQKQLNGAKTNKNKFYLIKKEEDEFSFFDKNKEKNEIFKNISMKRRPTSYMNKKYKGILSNDKLKKKDNNLINFSRQDKKIYLKTNNEKKIDLKKKKINLENINNIEVNIDKNFKSQNEETKENKNENIRNKRNIIIDPNDEPLAKNFFTDIYFAKNFEVKHNSSKKDCNNNELKENDKNKFIQFYKKAILL